MKFEEYCKLAPKTLKKRNTLAEDVDHMIIGLASEINEMQEALLKEDDVEVAEELGDFYWYTVVYANLVGYELHCISDNNSFDLDDLTNRISKLAGFYKNQVIYNKEQAKSLEYALLQNVFHALYNFACPVSPEEVWERNIAKLHKVRYKNATYTDEAANNRDLVAERKALENQQ